jgi:hypothetical protein
VTLRQPAPGGGNEAGLFLVGVVSAVLAAGAVVLPRVELAERSRMMAGLGFAVAILGFVMTVAFASAQWWQARRDVLYLRDLGVAGPLAAGLLSTILALAVASLPYVRATPWLGWLAAVLAAVGASRMLWKR